VSAPGTWRSKRVTDRGPGLPQQSVCACPWLQPESRHARRELGRYRSPEDRLPARTTYSLPVSCGALPGRGLLAEGRCEAPCCRHREALHSGGPGKAAQRKAEWKECPSVRVCRG
jgi:hypothetical protein